MIHIIDDGGITADVLLNADGRLAIAFDDPSYVLADAIRFHPVHLALYASVHGGLHKIADFPEDLLPHLFNNAEILLAAEHYQSGAIEMMAPLSALQH